MGKNIVCEVGLVGLGAMGSELALNLANHFNGVAVYNRQHAGMPSVADNFIKHQANGRNMTAAYTLQELAEKVRRPRIIILMVTDNAVQDVVDRLTPFLNSGDMIIDGGNSHYRDTDKRCEELEKHHIAYVGAGISGGTEGARKGASIMLGGSQGARERAIFVMQHIAAKLSDGSRCCGWFGAGGAGHFVKTIHNGIEYALMQLIAEAYAMLLATNASNEEIADLFELWDRGDLGSYLLKITTEILQFKEADGTFLINRIQDKISEKGSGRQSIVAAMNAHAPFSLTAESLYARYLSEQTASRKVAATLYPGQITVRPDSEAVRKSLYASMFIAYAQGFELLYKASNEGIIHNFERIPYVWKDGCIIRSNLLSYLSPFLQEIHPHGNLLLVNQVASVLRGLTTSWRKTVSQAIIGGISLPATTAALSYFDGLRKERSTAMLVEAQRDYFGAHGYERTDTPSGFRSRNDWHPLAIETI